MARYDSFASVGAPDFQGLAVLPAGRFVGDPISPENRKAAHMFFGEGGILITSVLSIVISGLLHIGVSSAVAQERDTSHSAILEQLEAAVATFAPAVVVPDSTAHFAPNISPDGRSLVFYAYRRAGTPDLAILDMENRRVHYLTDTPGNWEIEPQWDHFGQTVLFGSGADMPSIRPASLRVEDGRAAGSASLPTRLFDGMGSASRLDSAGRIVFAQRSGYPVRRRLAIMHPENEIDLIDVDFPEGEASSPIVMPDRGSLVFRLTRDAGSDLYHLRLASGQITRLTYSPAEEGYVAVSPNGEWISWSYEQEEGGHRVFGAPFDPASPAELSPRPLTQWSEGEVQFFSQVSSAGQWVYYDASTPEGFSLFRQRLDLDRTEPERLTVPESFD